MNKNGLQYASQHTFITLLSVVLWLSMIIFISPISQAAGLEIPQTPDNYSCSGEDCINSNPIIAWIQFGINALTVIIVAGAALMIAVAGVQYITGADNAQRVQEAKKRIFSIITALLAYFFLYAFVQWIIPGGVF